MNEKDTGYNFSRPFFSQEQALYFHIDIHLHFLYGPWIIQRR